MVLTQAEGLKPFAVTLTRDREAAKDLCQETLYKAFAYRDNYRPGTNMKAWLFTIMRNIFINDYRRNRRKRVIMDTLMHTASPLAHPAESTMRSKEIQHAVHTLPEAFRTSCQLYLQGYKYHEIALALDEPLGTIKSRIHFARKLLQKKIDR